MKFRYVIVTALLAACGSSNNDKTDAGTDAGSGSAKEYVYIESNDPTSNSIIGFSAAADGTLTPLAGSGTATGGAGITAGSNQRLGPLDSDHQIILSADKSTLFAVNAGSNSVAAFKTAADGSLTAVAGSPFATGGNNPVSVALTGSSMITVTKEADGNAMPGYRTLGVASGVLSIVANVVASVPLGGSPSTAVVSTDGKFLFGTEFLDGARPATAPLGQIDSFTIGANGALTAAPGSPYALPADTSGINPAPPAVALNLVEHPSMPILYVAFVTRAQLAVYTIDPTTGALTFVKTATNSGKAICWFVINKAGTKLYSVDSGTSAISVYDLTDPMTPVETSSITLKDNADGMTFTDAMGMTQTMNSSPFELAFSADQKHLWVVSQRVTTNAADPVGNYLHTLDVAADGSLTEPGTPIDLHALGLSGTTRAQGIVDFAP